MLWIYIYCQDVKERKRSKKKMSRDQKKPLIEIPKTKYEHMSLCG